METYAKYWTTSLVRGLVAILAGLAVLVLPSMITLVFLIPFAILVSMLCLAAYGVADSVIVLITSFMIRHDPAGRFALRAQGIGGAILGTLLFFLVYDRAQLEWFVILAALQALGTAITEFIVARHTSIHHGSRWCYASAAIAILSAIALILGRGLEPQRIAWLVFSYLCVFGLTLTVLSARMLFAERVTESTAAGVREVALARIR
ncbi:uncharacterized membrane protein HdeD (DUF308 family) [Granulicella aggregans]|uniref:Uncharacterized membrane protein HdeD (DUF308 family) n=1 Tax=Granulicella aggregans TaxID=474949 RepID=A0A7W8E721_9BACT|nr:hypothetical protein [Granulicella aggregans]MBB5060949.1 uncharacterized membrane protein HdeD (DUF308 family) [Granulicella aggregans]